MRRAGWIAVVALAAACSSGDDGEAATTTSAGPATTTTAPAAEATFEQRSCEDPVPDDTRVDCGDLTVADGVVLPVAIIRGGATNADPVVFVSGGPGYGALESVEFFLEEGFGGDRDVILFDQRGTGRATPSLDCPEVEPVLDDNQATADAVAVEQARLEEAMAACRERLVDEGVDLSAFDTPATAADLDALRRALGYEAWHVWGHSYGGLVAQELLRSYPDGLLSVVLDAPRPVDDAFGDDDVAVLALGALEHLFAGCAADPGCSAAYPALEADFRALVADWDTEPFPVVATGPDGTERSYLVTGADVVGGTFQALYDTGLIGALPSLIGTLAGRGDAAAAIVRPLLEDFLADARFLAEAQERSVNCAGEAALRAEPDQQLPAGEELVDAFAIGDVAGACAAWGVEPVPASFNELVTAAVPTLVLVGEYDPIHPPAVARRAADALSVSTLVELPGVGHGVVFSGDCGAELLRTFLDGALDDACVASLGPPAWVLP